MLVAVWATAAVMGAVVANSKTSSGAEQGKKKDFMPSRLKPTGQ
jgi:hypothetical protein